MGFFTIKTVFLHSWFEKEIWFLDKFRDYKIWKLSEAEAESVEINLRAFGFGFAQPTNTGFV